MVLPKAYMIMRFSHKVMQRVINKIKGCYESPFIFPLKPHLFYETFNQYLEYFLSTQHQGISILNRPDQPRGPFENTAWRS